MKRKSEDIDPGKLFKKKKVETQTPRTTSRKFLKRQVLFLCQYLGTGYYGSTYLTSATPAENSKEPIADSTTRDEEKKAIENEVHDAIVKAGGVEIERNRGDLRKLNWSRSSRTDKGVHAALNVFSARLSIFADYKDMPEAINKHLPQRIRLLDIFQVTKKFDARKACSSRKYEYILPSYVLSQKATSGDNFQLEDFEYKAVEELWKSFEGTHKFHNFTKGKMAHEKGVKRHMISMGVSRLSLDGSEYIQFSLHGQSFLFNQIRKMVGFVITKQRGKLPEDALELAFSDGNFKIGVAPAEGLFLVSSLFERHNVKMRNINQEDRQIQIEKYEKNIQNFKEEAIYPEIKRQWQVFEDWRIFVDSDYEWQEKEYQPKRTADDTQKTKEPSNDSVSSSTKETQQAD